MNSILDNLNDQQRRAVETTSGAVLVLSGAGTGKTRVLTARTANIMAMGLCAPWNILTLTFTNKAANEMKARIAALSDGTDGISDVWCGTFHSVCLRILRRNADLAGLRPDFLIFGEDEQKSVLKNIFINMNLDAKEYAPGDWISKISAVKDKGIGYKIPSPMLKKIYDAYNAELLKMSAVDFGDIILLVLELFAKNPIVAAKYQNQFKYIMVDEFQDTNNAQHQLLYTLSSIHKNICCVGDDDQSIYSWRGAEIEHILNFEKTYPGAKIIRLEINYRSTSNILNAANSLIAHNSGRLGKDLRPVNTDNAGERVYALSLPTDWDEARMITRAIENEANSSDYSDFAVLIRAGSLSRLFEEEFATKNIPYRLVGATKFYDRMEIKDAIAYIKLLVHPFDDLSFLRVIAKPRRGFGNTAISKLRDYGSTLMAAMDAAPLAPRARLAANEFLSIFNFDSDSMSPGDAAQKVLTDSGYIKFWKESKLPDATDRLSNIRELISNVISKYDNLSEFLEHASLMTTDDNSGDSAIANKNSVSIMTIHAAKGLEFNTVFMPAWEEGVFPNDMATREGSIEEERRLAYVAITRARKRAIISNAMSRMIFGERKQNPRSRFIDEISPQYLNTGAPILTSTQMHNAPSYKNLNTPRPRAKIQSNSSVGKLVSHPEMGSGVVIEDAGDILTIAFRENGIKKVAKSFIKFGL